MDFLHQKEAIEQQLEMLRSGRMTSGTHTWGSKARDTTEDDIERLTAAKDSLDKALQILTRLPPPDGTPAAQVHWYELQRITPLYKPGQEDRWTHPGQTSPEGALRDFERDARFPFRLEICADDDLTAEFVLSKRSAIGIQVGASQRVHAGEVLETFFVRPRPG
jgi:hypothetical protein